MRKPVDAAQVNEPAITEGEPTQEVERNGLHADPSGKAAQEPESKEDDA